ncbi:alpha/beta hydrolase fold domain-containing protein [bacterium]|nr:alpha/beta hydrolase fold domain-containing protein [bacterium]
MFATRRLYCTLATAALVVGAVAGVQAQTYSDLDTPMKVSDSVRERSKDEITPVTIEGAETFVYRQIEPDPMRLHVYKPKDWKPGDKRPALIWFFGGGFSHGTPMNSAGWARTAAKNGAVGIAPDYRVTVRHNSNATHSIADARLSMRWVQDHAEELGIDPKRIIVGGSSAGGGAALWSTLSTVPPGSTADESPLYPATALYLLCPVSDTSNATGYGGKRLGSFADAISPQHHLNTVMPTTYIFHGDADTTVPYDQSQRLHDKIVAAGGTCILTTAPGGTHKFASEMPEWKEKTRAELVTLIQAEVAKAKAAAKP